MSEFRADLQTLARDLVAGCNGPAALWQALLDAAVPEIGAHGEGDLEDLVACVREVGRALDAVPLAVHAVAEWAVGPGLAGTTMVATTPASLRSDDVVVDLRDVGWAPGVSELLVVGADRVVLVGVDPNLVELGTDVAGRPQAQVRLDGAPVLRESSVPVAAVRARLRILAAAELLGTAEAAIDLTRDYVSTREQFGRPLLRIPAVAHAIGRMRSDVVAGAAALTRAVAEVPEADRIVMAAMASTAGRVAAGAHQLHGAMGVTDEYPLHRLTRRLWVGRDRWGSSRGLNVDLGRRAIALGEDDFFDGFTAPAWWLTQQVG